MKHIAMLVGLLAALVSPAFAAPLYVSSHTVTANTSASLVSGRATLYKVIVSSPGHADSTVSISNGGTTIAVVDGSARRDLEYSVGVSSNLVYTTAGTSLPRVTMVYAKGIVPDSFNVLHSTGVYTTRAIRAGRALLKKVIVSKAGTAPSAVTIYDGNATATGRIVDVINTEAVSSVEYNVFVSSGLTYTATGNPNVTFIYDATPR